MLLSGCHSAEKAKQQLESQRKQEVQRQIAALRFRYRAVDDWPRQLAGKILAIEVQPVFVRPDHRPILFFAMLDDVRLENGAPSIYFSTIPTQGEPWMRVMLDCDGCDLPRLKGAAKSMDDIAVVAQITSAAKAIDQGEQGTSCTGGSLIFDSWAITR